MPDRQPPRKSSAEPPEECANCGAAIPRHARACPECGADDRTGWRQTDLYDGLDVPDNAYDDGSLAAKRGSMTSRRVNGVAWYWWAVGVLLVILLTAGIIALPW